MKKTIKIETLWNNTEGYTLKNKTFSRYQTMCDQAWNYVQFFPQRNAVNYCCRTSPLELTDEEILEQGTEIFWNPRHVVERRQEMLNGKRPEDCHVCWKLEMNGLESKRTVKHILPELKKTYPSISLDTNLNDNTVPWTSFDKSKSTKFLEIVLGNTCDSKCVYCSDYFSSLWAAEKRKYGEETYLVWENDFDSALVKTFWTYFEEAWPTLPHLNFIGGEPIIMKDFFRYLDKILEIADRIPSIPTPDAPIKKGLSVVTNGNTPPHLLDRFLQYAEKLDNYFDVHVQISGENTEEQLEYVRFGTSWNQWKENVEKYMKSKHINVQFLPAIQLLSLPTLYKYIDFIIEICKTNSNKEIRLNWASVNWPYEFNLDFIPKEIIPYIDLALESLKSLYNISEAPDQKKSIIYFIQSLMKVKNLGKKQNLSMLEERIWSEKFIKFFDNLDSRRNTTWSKTFPEFSIIKDIK
jgi:hypothetical protein